MSAIETIVTAANALEPLRLAEARDHLRIYTDDLDDQIGEAIKEVRAYCEAFTARTLRTTVTRKMSWSAWPDSPIWISHPPLIAVSSLTYYDASGNEQTVSSSNYRVITSEELPGRLEYISTWTAPTHATRSDAISLTYTAGYQTINAVPDCARRAMKILLAIEFDDTPPNREQNARDRAKDCLATLCWGPYR